MSKDWIPATWPAPPTIVAGTTLRDSHYQLPAEPQRLNQVHGATVVKAGSPAFAAGPPAADAIVADRAGDMCLVRTADCLPVLFCASDGKEIGAAHAGWRGLAAGVLEQTVAAMATPADELLAWFGPAIAQSAFEVGSEVREAFVAADKAASVAFVRNARGRWQADLYRLATQRLQSAGVHEIHGGGLCTHSDAERFFSYRRDGATGRLQSFVYRS